MPKIPEVIIGLLFLLIIKTAFSEMPSQEVSTNQYYLVIGSLDEINTISWIDPSSPLQVSYNEGNRILLRINAPLSYSSITFNDYNIFMIINGTATNISTSKKLMLLDKPIVGKMQFDNTKYLFHAETYDPPDGFVTDNNLEDCLVLIVSKGSFPLKEGSYVFDQKLKKYGIMFSKGKQ